MANLWPIAPTADACGFTLVSQPALDAPRAPASRKRSNPSTLEKFVPAEPREAGLNIQNLPFPMKLCSNPFLRTAFSARRPVSCFHSGPASMEIPQILENTAPSWM
jgi:hypothetical protein